MFAIDAVEGDRQWRVPTDGRVLSSPTVADGVVFVGSWDRHLYALDAATGDRRWRFETGGEISSSPTVVDGTVYVGANDGSVYAIEADIDGSSRGSRVRRATLGHTDDRTLPDRFSPSSRFDGDTARSLAAGGTAGLLAGAGLLYRGSKRSEK